MGCSRSVAKKSQSNEHAAPIQTKAEMPLAIATRMVSVADVTLSSSVPRVYSRFIHTNVRSGQWIIEGFTNMIPTAGRCYESPPIPLGDFVWVLELYPGGDAKAQSEKTEYVSLWLSCSHDCVASEKIELKGCVNHEKKGCPGEFKRNRRNRFGYTYWISRAKLLKPELAYLVNDCMTITLTISTFEEITVPTDKTTVSTYIS